MKILITGSSGMLGIALCQELSSEHEVIGLDVRQLDTRCSLVLRSLGEGGMLDAQINCDITDKEKTVQEIADVKPDLVIHAAAFTDVDGSELDSPKAYSINGEGTQNVALGCQKCDVLLFYISTDFIFDGSKKKPYVETDEPNPLNVYGASKLKGEKYVQSLLHRFFIVRSSWLFGQGGGNFVEVIIEKGRHREKLKVVDDQVGSPTYTRDLAKAIHKLISLLTPRFSLRQYGIYHLTNSGICSRYEYARQILKYAGIGDVNVERVTSDDGDRLVRRPKMSALDNVRYQQLTGEVLRPWQEALKVYLEERL